MSATMEDGRASGQPRSYYGQAVIKEPIWKPEIPWYFFSGGLGGASAGLAYMAGLRGNEELARRAWATALAGIGVSPALLISDLGKPTRFLNMLRMFKVTSPMSVGSWILAASGATTGVAAIHSLTGRFAALAQPARPASALLGLPLASYTGGLIAQTAVPAWHEARRELPALFAAGGAASAGAALTAITPARYARAARRLALVGSAAELAGAVAVEQRLGELGEPYHVGAAGAFGRAARALTAAGALLVGARAERSRPAAVAGGTMILAGAVCERWCVFKAGFQSARDPSYTVGPQRERANAEPGHRASRRAVGGDDGGGA
jgi:formate-dependent nitrite reductase membrane component NrfD